MTGRERIEAVCNCEPIDRLSWAILADDRSIASLPPSLRHLNAIGLCRELVCDVFQWSGLGLGPAYFLRNPVRTLLPMLHATGLDGIHAVTPPPVGDTTPEDVLDALGDDVFFVGAMDPGPFIHGSTSDVRESLEARYSPRVRGAHMILSPFVDGIHVPLDNVRAIADWFEANGEIA